MVMRNRHEEPGWWEDLPPKMRERFGTSAIETDENEGLPAKNPPAASRSFERLREYCLLAMLILSVGIALMIFLVLVMALVDGVNAPLQFLNR